MREKNNITRGGLAGKMGGYTPEPPDSVWTSISGRIGGRSPKRSLFIFISVAAGLALALGLGLPLILGDQKDAPYDQLSSLPENQDVKKQSEGLQGGDTGTNAFEAPITDNASSDKAIHQGEEQERIFKSKLEEKVLLALEEITAEDENQGVANQIQGENEAISDLANITIAELRDSKLSTADSMQHTANTAGQNQADRVDNSSDETSANQQNIETLTINEDSLLQLLEPEIIPEEETKKSTPGKWQIGASLSPQFSYRDVASNDLTQNMKVNTSESGKLTYAGGIKVNYAPSKRLSFESGIYYNKMGVNIGNYRNFTNSRFESLDFAPMAVSNNVVSISNSMGTIIAEDNSMYVSNYTSNDAVADYHLLQPKELVVNEAMVDGFAQTFEFLEIPFNLRYLIIDRSFKVQLIGGMSTNFLVGNTVEAATPNGPEVIGEVEDVDWINYSGNAGIGFAYEILKNFSFNLEPRFRYYINSINSSDLPITRPYTFGVRTGVSYTF